MRLKIGMACKHLPYSKTHWIGHRADNFEHLTTRLGAGQADMIGQKGGNPVGLVTVRYAFERKTTVSDAVAYIKSMWKDKDVEKAETVKVDGIDEWGVSRRVELDEKIPSFFGDLDHDEIIAESTSFDPELKKSYVIRKLREVIKGSLGIFG